MTDKKLLKEAVDIIQNLKAYGTIRPIEGVTYPGGSHVEYIKKADLWLYNYRKNQNQ